MERKKWSWRGEGGRKEGGERDRIRGRNTAKQFLYNHVFSFPRKESSNGEGWRYGGEFTCARVFERVLVARVCEKKKKKKEKTDELPLVNRSLLRFSLPPYRELFRKLCTAYRCAL